MPLIPCHPSQSLKAAINPLPAFVMVHKLFLFLLALTILCGVCMGTEEQQQTIEISPKCAAVLVTAGATGGGAIAVALCQVGFCLPIYLAFVSWWQNTMSLVQSESLVYTCDKIYCVTRVSIFGTLKSIAMGGVSAKMIVTGSVLGGQLSMTYLQQLCGYVDNPDSEMAP